MRHLVSCYPISFMANAGNDGDGRPRNGGADVIRVPPAEIRRTSSATHDADYICLQLALLAPYHVEGAADDSIDCWPLNRNIPRDDGERVTTSCQDLLEILHASCTARA